MLLAVAWEGLMFFRIFFLIALFLSTSALVEPSKAGTIREFNVAGWQAGAYTGKTSREFTHCAASAHYNSGITALFSINRTFHWTMGFYHPQWRLNVGSTFNIAFKVDDEQPIFATATAIGINQVSVPLLDSAELFKKFQHGYQLRVAAANQVFTFNLTGTSKLLPALLECARNRGARNEVAANPFEKKEITGAIKNDSAMKAEATVFAANLLSSAGLSNFKLLDSADAPELRGQARWIQGSTFGSIDIYPSATAADLKNLPGYLIGADAKACKGAFFSGAIPDSTSAALARIFTTCQLSDKPITIYYLAVPRKAGGAYVISTISLGSEQPAKEADQLLRSAVFKMEPSSTLPTH
jgi:hypothetical protein